MGRAGPALLAALAVGGVLTACSWSREKTSDVEPSATGCPRHKPRWPSPARPVFFPQSRAGLLLRKKDRCLYLVDSGDEEARPLWGALRGESVRRVAWAPDGQSVAITVEAPREGRHVVLVRRDGTVLRRLTATGAVFLHDGRLAVSRPDSIDLLVGSRAVQLASREELERVAGFRARREPLSLGHDPLGFTRGHGRAGLGLTLWGGRSEWKSVVLVVSSGGEVTRASPAYRARGIEGVVLGWAWSPDGRELFVMSEVPGPPERRRRASHDHCLDMWSPGRGRRRAFCESELPKAHHSHFSKLAWGADGETGLLDTGTILTRDGKVLRYAAVSAGALMFELQWEPERGYLRRRADTLSMLRESRTIETSPVLATRRVARDR